MHRSTTLLMVLGLPLAGCTAAKSTYHLAQAEQAIYLAKDTEAPDKAVYEWTKAQEFMRKAREEWGYADYGAAEDLSRKASDWASQADQVAKNAEKSKVLDAMPELVPEEIDRSDAPDQPEIRAREELLEVPDDLDDDPDEE